MDVPSGLEVPTKVVNLPKVSDGVTECLFSCKRQSYWLVWDQSCEGLEIIWKIKCKHSA